MEITSLADAFYALILAIIAILTALGYIKTNATHDIAVTNKANIDTMNTAQSIQMVAAQPAQLITATPIQSTYRKMTDSVKADTCDDISLADQQSFLAQVQFNEEAKNIRYTVSLSKGFLIVDSGCIADDSMPPLKEG